MMLVVQPRDVLVSWLCKRVGYVPTPHMTCIGLTDRAIIRAVVGYDHFTGKACQMHVAGIGTNWMTRDLLFAAFDYPFRELGLNAVLGFVDGSNKDAINLNLRLGFKEVHRVVDGHPDGDLIIFEMKKADCKWLSLRSRVKWARNLQDSPETTVQTP
jgi:hypothetical protein